MAISTTTMGEISPTMRIITPETITNSSKRPFEGRPAEDGAVVEAVEGARVAAGPYYQNRIENFATAWGQILDLNIWHSHILNYGYQVEFQLAPPTRRCLNLDSAQGCQEKKKFEVILL